MRIAFVTFEYPPHFIGGAGIYAINVTRELAKLGHQVIVFTPEANNKKVEKYVNYDLEIIRVEVNSQLPFKALQFWLRLPKILEETERENKFDIIHFNGISYGFFNDKVSTAPHIITVHHLVKDAIKNNNLGPISRIKDVSGENGLFIPFIEKRCIEHADKIIAVSNYTKRRIIENYKIASDKVEVIYNGTSLNEDIFIYEELEETKKRFNLAKKPIILFVGRVDDPRKGAGLLLRVFKNVLEKNDVMLLIVGKGDQTKARDLAKSLDILENVTFTGFVDETTLKKCYSLCDIYVCPSRLEGFGLTIVEAMRVGKPIVATNVGAIPELVKNEENGILVDPGDLVNMSNAIDTYLQDTILAENVGIVNKIHVKERFSWEKSANQIEKLYIRALVHKNA